MTWTGGGGCGGDWVSAVWLADRTAPSLCSILLFVYVCSLSEVAKPHDTVNLKRQTIRSVDSINLSCK